MHKNVQLLVLIIDDEDLTRRYIGALLENRKYRVIEADNGKDGIRLFKSKKPDLVLVDLRMPEMDGLEVLIELNKYNPDVPLIVISATGNIKDAVEATRRGAWEYVIKPIKEPDPLYHAIDRAMERFRLITENRHYQENLEDQVRQRTEELVKLNKDLSISEARYRSVVEDQTETIIRYTPDGICTFVNESYCRLFGKSRMNFLGSSFYAQIYEADRDHVVKKIKSLSSANPVEVDERRVILPNGELVWQQCTDRIILNEKRKIVEYQGVGVDITERKKGEEALKEALKEVERLKNKLHDEVVYLREEIKLEHNFDNIIGKTETLKKILKQVEIVAPNDTTVLILGETGTGKELIARAVHNLSSRRARPLVKVNCAALPSNLIESELFGHEKGSFTGATTQRIGRFELADGSSIFLDEIGDLPLDLQVKLLRVLQEGEFERVGGSQTNKVNVRIIAATNRNLKKAIESGRFREDLYYRLNVIPIELPPLRERKKDIELLAMHFAQKYGLKQGKNFTNISRNTISYLQGLEWAGNIRELENIIERSVIFSQPPELKLDDRILSTDKIKSPTSHSRSLEAIEREHILKILTEKSWVIEGEAGAANVLKLHPNTLRSKMKKLKISKS